MKTITYLALLFIYVFCTTSYGLNVDNYYKNTSNDYFKYFYPKLFQDPYLGIGKASPSDKKIFDDVFNIWLDQVNDWSFKKENLKIYYLNIFYKIHSDQKVIQEITLCFKDIKKITTYLLKNKTNNTIVWTENSFAIKFNKNLKITSYVNKINNVRVPGIKNYEFFPDYLFYSKTDLFDFFFKDWRIPVETIVFENKKPVGFYIP
jgi:hypothetical protein